LALLPVALENEHDVDHGLFLVSLQDVDEDLFGFGGSEFLLVLDDDELLDDVLNVFFCLLVVVLFHEENHFAFSFFEVIAFLDEIVFLHSPHLEELLQIDIVLVEGSSQDEDLFLSAENLILPKDTEGFSLGLDDSVDDFTEDISHQYLPF
jgi:hypothetical protein